MRLQGVFNLLPDQETLLPKRAPGTADHKAEQDPQVRQQATNDKEGTTGCLSGWQRDVKQAKATDQQANTTSTPSERADIDTNNSKAEQKPADSASAKSHL